MLHEAIKFYNPTDKNFVGKWDGEPYDVPAKSTKYFEPAVAQNFAKHLANEILTERFENLCKEHSSSTKDLLKTCPNCKTRNDKLLAFYSVPEREELYKLILPKEEVVTKEVVTENPVAE
ncbi:MAG: hypothetical protein AAB922_01315 [Patescibacteria group bacterium]